MPKGAMPISVATRIFFRVMMFESTSALAGIATAMQSTESNALRWRRFIFIELSP
jgi:hypothetical protein